MDFFVVLSGRRVDLANGHYVDYIGHGYPFGDYALTLPPCF